MQRVNAYSDHARQLPLMLEANRVDVVLDVGANTGQFASELREAGYRGRIVSFELLGAAHAMLVANVRGDDGWQVAPRMAVGAHDGSLEINVAANSVSSSILPMLDSHSSVERSSVYARRESVGIRRLDSLAGGFLTAASRAFVKIDAQGYKSHVLDGMEGISDRVAGLTCEMSLTPLYGGQRLWREVVDRRLGRGYDVWALQQGFTDMLRGRCLQVDGVFLRGKTRRG